MTPHYPRVRITSPAPNEKYPWTVAVLTTIEVDGAVWPCTGYSIEGGSSKRGADDFQTITLTFVADVTVEHTDPVPPPSSTREETP